MSSVQKNGGSSLAKSTTRTVRRGGLMKDRFHYLQPAYNEVGEEAGRSVAAYWNR